jgi:membrane glycosyltransferase
MVPTLRGSYEEGPPSLTDMLVRDRRWCQGNLQHGAVLAARGLHWISRTHLLIGIGHYFTAPMWAMLMLIGLAIPLQEAGINLEQLRIDGFTPSVYWRGGDPERYLWVFAFTMGVLLAPKVMGYLATLADRETRRGCGGAIRIFVSMLLETVLAALMAPITMYRQSRGVAEVLAGKDSGWETQRRDDGSLPLSSLVRSYGGLSLAGLLAGAAAYAISPALAAWMAPVILGLMLAIPLNLLTSSVSVGQWLRRIGLLRIPEESAPPPVLARALELRESHALAPPSNPANN